MFVSAILASEFPTAVQFLLYSVSAITESGYNSSFFSSSISRHAICPFLAQPPPAHATQPFFSTLESPVPSMPRWHVLVRSCDYSPSPFLLFLSLVNPLIYFPALVYTSLAPSWLAVLTLSAALCCSGQPHKWLSLSIYHFIEQFSIYFPPSVLPPPFYFTFLNLSVFPLPFPSLLPCLDELQKKRLDMSTQQLKGQINKKLGDQPFEFVSFTHGVHDLPFITLTVGKRGLY